MANSISPSQSSSSNNIFPKKVSLLSSKQIEEINTLAQQTIEKSNEETAFEDLQIERRKILSTCNISCDHPVNLLVLLATTKSSSEQAGIYCSFCGKLMDSFTKKTKYSSLASSSNCSSTCSSPAFSQGHSDRSDSPIIG